MTFNPRANVRKFVMIIDTISFRVPHLLHHVNSRKAKTQLIVRSEILRRHRNNLFHFARHFVCLAMTCSSPLNIHFLPQKVKLQNTMRKFCPFCSPFCLLPTLTILQNDLVPFGRDFFLTPCCAAIGAGQQLATKQSKNDHQKKNSKKHPQIQT